MISNDTLKKINGSNNHWIDTDGNVYILKDNGDVVKKAQSTKGGYKYCMIDYNGVNKYKRVHRLVAEAFIPNPNNYNIIGHRNNIKTDNRVDNLYWSSGNKYIESDNIKIYMYETATNKLLRIYDSIIEASLYTDISANIISRQAKYGRPTRKPYYFRFSNDESVNPLDR